MTTPQRDDSDAKLFVTVQLLKANLQPLHRMPKNLRRFIDQARLCKLQVEVVGAPAGEGWFWLARVSSSAVPDRSIMIYISRYDGSDVTRTRTMWDYNDGERYERIAIGQTKWAIMQLAEMQADV